ncbi:CBL-interacting serine/threonine-protein kinase 23 [Diplonema papillatum]|nr:CBL-interacting serine/threonine-protein kinase 23 [Diplonema papillatum]
MGRQVGKWKLGKEVLGSGSFGEVKLARHFDTGQIAAAKCCAKQTLAKGQGRTLLQREIATMKELNHPSILKLFEVLETSRHFYLVLELASGGELFDLIQENKRFGDKTARKYFHQLILGVRYCHEQGIVHRDLKPQNLLLTGNDELKIADFGFSNIQNLNEDGKVTPTLRLKTQCGTPNYAAPEIFLGKGYNGFKTDVWSCGVILYVMLCGHVPFRPTGSVGGLQGVIMSIVEGRYSIPDSISPGAADLIKKILEPDVEKRLSIAQIIDHPWFQEDFDVNRLFTLPKIVVSEANIRNSIMPTNETDVPENEFDQTVSPDDDVDALTATTPTDTNEIVDALTPLSPHGGFPGAGRRKPTSPRSGPPVAAVQSPSSGAQPILPGPPALAPDVNDLLRNNNSSSFSTDQLGRTLKGIRGGSAAGLIASSSWRKSSPSDSRQCAHVFQRKHWNSPRWCFICKKFIYGIGKQGFSCINCSCPVHIKCVEAADGSSCDDFRAAGSPQRLK